MARNRRRRIEFRQMTGCNGLGSRRCGSRLVVAAIGALRGFFVLRIGMSVFNGFVAGGTFGNRFTRMGQRVFQAMAGQGRLHHQKGAGQGKQYASKSFHLRADYTLSRRSP